MYHRWIPITSEFAPLPSNVCTCPSTFGLVIATFSREVHESRPLSPSLLLHSECSLCVSLSLSPHRADSTIRRRHTTRPLRPRKQVAGGLNLLLLLRLSDVVVVIVLGAVSLSLSVVELRRRRRTDKQRETQQQLRRGGPQRPPLTHIERRICYFTVLLRSLHSLYSLGFEIRT